MVDINSVILFKSQIQFGCIIFKLDARCPQKFSLLSGSTCITPLLNWAHNNFIIYVIK